MMKNKIVAYLIAGIAAVLALGSCSSGVSYAELLRDERKATNKFLAHQRVENEIPADTIFETGPAAPYYRLDEDGKVVYSDMLIRFSFVNQYNALEEDLLYIFNPLERRDMTGGLLCGISSADLMPCAFRCLVTLTPREPTEEFISSLMITKKELRRWQKLNMLIVDNRLPE